MKTHSTAPTDSAEQLGAEEPVAARRRGAGATCLPVVGVMGSGVRAHADLAVRLGRGLARMGVHLLTGGGGGVMASASRAFAEVEGRAGLVVGVLPGSAGGRSPADYPNPFVELAVRTHLDARGADGDSAASRNHVNVLSSDVVVALPGGEGTASEVVLALRYGRPLVLLGDVGRAQALGLAQATGQDPDGARGSPGELRAQALGLVRTAGQALGPASPSRRRAVQPQVWATESPAEALSLVRRALASGRALDRP